MITREEFLKSLLPIEHKVIEFYRHILEQEKPKEALEIGSGWGLFSRSAMEWSEAKVTTVDKIGGYGLEKFEVNCAGFENRIERIVEDSQKFLPGKEVDWKERFDMVFVDGDHTESGASKDFNFSWPLLRPGGLMMVDDVFHRYNWSRDPGNESGFNFGVTMALWGFIQGKRPEFEETPKIISVGHGVVLIRKKNQRK